MAEAPPTVGAFVSFWPYSATELSSAKAWTTGPIPVFSIWVVLLSQFVPVPPHAAAAPRMIG